MAFLVFFVKSLKHLHDCRFSNHLKHSLSLIRITLYSNLQTSSFPGLTLLLVCKSIPSIGKVTLPPFPSMLITNQTEYPSPCLGATIVPFVTSVLSDKLASCE